jgi:hypothetical protein
LRGREGPLIEGDTKTKWKGDSPVDVAQIATVAVALLVPYLAKATEGLASKAGEVAWDKVVALYKAVCRKLSADKDEKAQQTLRRMEEQPADEERQTALMNVLTEKARTDPVFKQELAQLVQVATQEETIAFLTQVYDRGRVDKIINISQADVVNID